MKKRIILLISIFFICINYVYAKETVKLSKCIDGDTVKLIIDEKEVIIRLLAVDTPESVDPKKKTEYYGKEASQYTCEKLTNAKKIELEYDNNVKGKDRFNRILAWIFVDGKLLQEDLVQNGYAKVTYLYSNYKYTSVLKEKQKIASSQKLGIWNEVVKKEYEENNTENVLILIVFLLFIIIIFISSIITKIKINNISFV